jgi:hypothetical protein
MISRNRTKIVGNELVGNTLVGIKFFNFHDFE